MGMKTRVFAVVLVAAVGVYLVVRAAPGESVGVASVENPAGDVGHGGAEPLSGAQASGVVAMDGAVQRKAVTQAAPGEGEAALGVNVLRVVVDGITEEEAREVSVTLSVRDEDGKRVAGAEGSWVCRGLTSEFDLDPLFARVEERGLRVGLVRGRVDHPLHLFEPFLVTRSEALVEEGGRSVYEVAVRFSGTVFWPELALSVRDAHTREHLEDVEIHCIGSEYMNQRRQPGPGLPYSEIGRGLSSPVALLGGHEADELARVGAVAVRTGAGEEPQVVELPNRSVTDRGMHVYVRAPGYAWGRILVDFSSGGEREVLLGKGASLGVRLANVQIDRYAALGKPASLMVHQEGWGVGYVRVQPLDEALEAEGLWIEGIEPGKLVVTVEMGGEWSSRRTVVLAREEVSLVAGETRELVLALADPPPLPERVTVGGVLSFPEFGVEEGVRLQLYEADWGWGEADVELSLAEMERIGGAPPTWSFRLEDVPVGTCQIHLLPFLKGWMIDVPPGGREDVELVIPELAEVLVEAVDARTSERVPLEKLRYVYMEELPGRVHNIWSDQVSAPFEGEPGVFRFWTAPGSAYIATWGTPNWLNYGSNRVDLELAPGLQSVRLELSPPCSIRFEAHVDGATLPYDDRIYRAMGETIRAVGHDGSGGPAFRWFAEVSGPGLYEIGFEGVGSDRFLPIPSQRVEVREGEEAEVIVELQRK